MIPEGASFGPYRVLRRLGGGGAGEVFLAEPIPDTAARGPGRVALKVLDGHPDDPAVRQLLRELEAASSLRNAHIIPQYGLAYETSSVAVVMGYAPSGSLGDTLRAGNRVPLPLPLGVVARIVMQLAGALESAHAAGLVHGDLKPNNIFVRTSPQGAPLAVLSDFGQAVLTRAAVSLARGESTTSEQAAWITQQLSFVAPEQLDANPIPASDQYAMAAVAYYLLSGHLPITGEARALPAAIANAPVAPPSQYNPRIPAEADRVILRALAKQPEARFPSVARFAETLDETLAILSAQGGSGVGVTAQMSALAEPHSGSHRAAHGRLAVADPAAWEFDLAEDAILPDDASPRLRRALGIGVGVAVFALVLTCALSLFWSGGDMLKLAGTIGSGNASAPVATAPSGGTTSSRDAQAAQQQLATVMGRTPIFSDNFTSNAAHWATNSMASVHDGHLYLTHSTGQTLALEKTPGSPHLSAVAVRADVALTQGNPSDVAGICFFATSDAKGNTSFMCYLTSADGRYELWNYRAQWSYITGGYSSILKLGMGQANTLAVLANAAQGDITLFANGSYLTRVQIGANPSLTGTQGLLVLNIGAQATFANYAVYNPGA